MPSKLIKDLKSVPDIIGELGLNIAAAQKALNHDYITNLKLIVDMAKELVGKPAGAPPPPPAVPPPAVPAVTELDVIAAVIKQLAPVRYVYTETWLAVKLDLAQSIEGGAEVGLGGGIGAIMVNASFSLAFSQEYRGTAECRTVIHPDSRSGAVSDAMMSRAKDLSQTPMTLTDVPKVDQEIFNSLKSLRDGLKN